MLDQSVPYYNVLMHRKPGSKIPDVILPDGYRFVTYEKGDEQAWAEIEASVKEFDSTKQAFNYFNETYLPFIEDLEKRTIFIEHETSEKVATFTMWWNSNGEHTVPEVHWVAVKPTHQGLGLGKAVVFEGMKRSIELLGDIDYYLHTQTWSYQAVGVYLTAGFYMMQKETFGQYENQQEQALPILKEKMKSYYFSNN